MEREAWSVERYLPPFGFTGHYSLATRHSPRIGRTIPLGCLARYHAQSKLNLAGEFRPLYPAIFMALRVARQ